MCANSRKRSLIPSGSFVGESNFDVYREIAGMTEDEIGTGVGEGLFN